ncbi:hypothetical protein DF143_05600 [Burkholderia cenocepacia]|nr:hypothetical protein DF143_05600 [Burkholderia cenocepacia]RQV47287.1 hypothetical protein DF033_10410 [Burkholderia cenocepacia]
MHEKRARRRGCRALFDDGSALARLLGHLTTPLENLVAAALRTGSRNESNAGSTKARMLATREPRRSTHVIRHSRAVCVMVDRSA